MTAAVREDRKLQNRALLGVLLMTAGLALYPLADAFVKHLMGTYTVHQTTFLRSVTRVIPLLIAMFFQGGPKQILATAHPGRHLVRLAVNLTYTLSFMYAVKLASLTSIYSLSYTSPLFMIILSALMLKESVGWQKWVAVALGLAGVVFAMQPGKGVLELASILVLVGTFLGALNKILMRRLASTEHSLAIAIYPNLMMILAMTPLFFFIDAWKPMPLEHWGLFAIVGVLTAAGQYMIAQSLRFAQASTLAPIDYSTLFWVITLDIVWWDKSPENHTLIGAAIIILSNFYILYCARREEAKKKVLSTAS
jgi:drug/metabolite transporter (DMT)-like permease